MISRKVPLSLWNFNSGVSRVLVCFSWSLVFFFWFVLLGFGLSFWILFVVGDWIVLVGVRSSFCLWCFGWLLANLLGLV